MQDVGPDDQSQILLRHSISSFLQICVCERKSEECLLKDTEREWAIRG